VSRAPASVPVRLPALPDAPLVSVLISCYNYGRYVGRAIESVLNQTYQSLEVVVCDDGSTDESADVIQRYVEKDPRVKAVRQANAGHPAAYGAAYRASRGDILCILDADDTFAPHKVEALVRCFRRDSRIGYVIHPLIMIDGEDRHIQPLTLLDSFEEGFIADRIVRRGGRWRSMTASGISFRRELAPSVYPIPDGIYADVLFNTVLPLMTHVAVVRDYLGFYRLHGGNMTGEIRNHSSVEETTRSIRKYLEHIDRALSAVNQRLVELNLNVPPLDARNNLDYRMRTFALALFVGPKQIGRCIAEFGSLAAAIARDDLYRMKHKCVLLAGYGLATIAPRRIASWTVEAIHMPNRLKYVLLRALGFGRMPVPSRPPAAHSARHAPAMSSEAERA
jgi:glycosyltransferase involved in cell wall biosynthesis